MRTSKLRSPTPALLVSIIALLVAMGGTGYAAVTLAKNSVGTSQLKNNAVTSEKIKNAAVTGTKLNLSGFTVPNALHANAADTAASATNAATATNATHAASADTATNAANASHATNADDATTATNAVNATNATNATNASELGGLLPSSFVQGGGTVFGAHAVLSSSGSGSGVSIPGLGELQATLVGGPAVAWQLTNGTNGTGEAVDQAVGYGTNFEDETVGPGSRWNSYFGGGTVSLSGPLTLTVQFAWGSGETAHEVTLTASEFASSSDYDVIIQGIAQ